MDFKKAIASLVPQWLKKEIQTPFVSSTASRLPMEYPGGFWKKKNFLEEYKNWPYACATARAEDVANIQLKLMKGDEEVTDDPILDLINRVNDGMTKKDLFIATQVYKDLDGNAFWFLARETTGSDNKKGDVKEIYILKPDRVHIVLDKENGLKVAGYVYAMKDGTRIPFDPEEIIHHRVFNPLAEHPFPGRGMGVVEAAAWAIDTDNEIRQWNYKFFRNSAQPKGILAFKGEGSLDPDEFKRIKEEWSVNHQGSENAYKTAIISGNMEWQETTSTQSEMEFMDQRLFSRDEILALFRTPKSILGITDDVNRANADAAIYVFALRTIKPLMQHLVDTMNEFLLPILDDTEEYHFEFVSPVPEDRAAIISEYSAGIDKWLSRNEIRAREGLPPSANGDQFFGTLAQVPIDNTIEESKKNLKPQYKKEKNDAEKIVDAFVAKMPKAVEVKQLSDLAKKNHIEWWNKNIEVNSAALQRELIKYFERQEKIVQKNLRQEMKGLNPLEFKLKAVEDIVFDMPSEIQAGISLITPFIKEYIKKSGEQGTILAGGEMFDDGTASIDKFVKDRASYFSESVNNTTRDKILSQVQDGIDNSETIDQISTRISGVFEDATTSRTVMIARTEVSASSNFGATEAYSQAGIEQHQWIVVDPQDIDCSENDGAIVKIGDEFPDGDVQPPVHPNCVCTTIPIF